MARRDIDIGDAELATMRVLWDHGPQTVREVMERLHERGRRVAYTTVLTFLSRLEQKGLVRSDRNDQAYVYKAKVTKASVTRTRVKALMEQLFDGAAGPVLMHLIENERLTAEEVHQLRRLIDHLDRGPSQTP